MNILFIVPYAPNLIRVRPYQLLRGLARRGHAVTLATLWSSERERASLARWEAEGVQVMAARLTPWRSATNCVAALPAGTPLQAGFCWEPRLAAQMTAALRTGRYDVVHVEHLRGARYGLRARSVVEAIAPRTGVHPQSWEDLTPPPPSRRGKGGRRGWGGGAWRTPVVWDSVDCISYLFEQAARRSGSLKGRLMARVELARTRRYEAWLQGQFERVLVTSEIDRRALLGLARARADHVAPVTVLPNGVDLDYFTPGDEPRQPATVVFSGKMSYHANVTAARYLVAEVMPRVWARQPETRVVLVGKDPTREVRTLAKGTGRVVVTGTVEDIRPYLRRATLAVAPMLYGAGVQNKVLEAMACGTPVVATGQAVAALQARPGQEVVVAEGAEALAQAILALLDDPARRERLGRAGRVYVEREHSWERIVARLEAVYREERGEGGAVEGAAHVGWGL